MKLQIDNTHHQFVLPRYYIGQKLKTPDFVGLVTGLQFTTGDYQQWLYSVAEIFLGEGLGDTPHPYSEYELQRYN